jgi:hypothetical protein
VWEQEFGFGDVDKTVIILKAWGQKIPDFIRIFNDALTIETI